MGPWAALSNAIAAALEGEAHKPSVLAGPRAQVVPDAIVIRPDTPWISRGDQKPVRFGAHGTLERYVAVCATRVSDPGSAMDALYTMVRAVQEAASDNGWDWVDVAGIGLDETTDTPLLVASVRLTYNG